jgi:hypothetical protein
VASFDTGAEQQDALIVTTSISNDSTPGAWCRICPGPSMG